MELNAIEKNGLEWNGMKQNKYATPLLGFLMMEWNKIPTPLFGNYSAKEWFYKKI